MDKPLTGDHQAPEYHGFFGPGLAGGRHVVEMDVVGGSWFVETSWTKLLFREHLFATGSGEDYQIGYALKKYANRRNFVLPPAEDWAYNGFSQDYVAISIAGDTTGDRSLPGPDKFDIRYGLA